MPQQAPTPRPIPFLPEVSWMLLVHLEFLNYVKIYQTHTVGLFDGNFKLLFQGTIQCLPHSVIKGL